MAATTSRKSCRRCFSQEIPLWLAYSHPEYHPAASDVVYYIVKMTPEVSRNQEKRSKKGLTTKTMKGALGIRN